MWGRDKNFQVLMMYELLNRENKISLTKVFYCSPFSYESATQSYTLLKFSQKDLISFLYEYCSPVSPIFPTQVTCKRLGRYLLESCQGLVRDWLESC